MSWKDFFYFTSSQRRALIVLLLLSFVLLGVNLFFLFSSNSNNEKIENAVFLTEVEKFRVSLEENKSTDRYKKTYTDYYKSKSNKEALVLFSFNPNTLDSAGFISLGLRPYMVRNILKYREKGGRFRTKEAFSKVYGLTADQFQKIEPFIQIPKKEETNYIKNEPTVRIIELNAADTTQLKQLAGIGSGFAKRIVAYRNKLGGFYSVSQLKEVWGLSLETVKKITPYVAVDVSQLKKIPVNKSSVDRLRSHPYINFYQAKAIYEYRKNEGEIQSIEECKKMEDESLTPEFWEKVKPYIGF